MYVLVLCLRWQLGKINFTSFINWLILYTTILRSNMDPMSFCLGCNFPMKDQDDTCEKTVIQAMHYIKYISTSIIWSEWRLTVIAATVRIALVDILDLSEVDIPAGVFLHPTVGWG